MNQLTNPRKVQTWHQKFINRARGLKVYRAGFEMTGGIAKFSRKHFRTANEAEGYGLRVILRWMRLYDAALLAMVGDETVTVHSEVVEPTV